MPKGKQVRLVRFGKHFKAAVFQGKKFLGFLRRKDLKG